MKNIIYNIESGISNLFHWFKIIWCDRNFDQIYFYKITLHKLNMMINSFEKESHNKFLASNSIYEKG